MEKRKIKDEMVQKVGKKEKGTENFTLWGQAG